MVVNVLKIVVVVSCIGFESCECCYDIGIVGVNLCNNGDFVVGGC